MSDKHKLFKGLFFPLLFISLIWLIKIIEVVKHLDLSVYGIYPLKASGLIGIITSPLIHEDFSHLSANTVPIIVLAACLFYFYNKIAYKVFFLIYFMTNIWVWSFAREAYHIGASGLVYGLASFLFVSGIIRRHNQLMAISMLILFLYGGIIWGVFPKFYPEKNISWESHLLGFISGMVLALYLKKEGPQRKIYEWENEEFDPNDEEEINEFLDKHYYNEK